MNNMLDPNLKLCFVKRNFAWFTSCPIAYQRGDDWDDAPYEFSAGDPYTFHETKDGKKQSHTVVKVFWEASYITPDMLEEKSSWSAKSINRGNVPWLSASPWADQELSPIHSGTALGDFIKHIKNAGGEVYTPACENLSLTTSELARETPVEEKKDRAESKSKPKKKKKSR